ncbi:MAG: DUF4118 domain-containing protein [Candidatus Aminicenantes bacterium]|nr:DUF4118 domain-containing protein [Candidatus Aminicenantes bacterium]
MAREGVDRLRRLKEYFKKHFDLFIIVIILLGIIAIAILVHYKLSLLNFFFLPVILAGYFLGKRQGVLTALLCILLVALYLFFLRHDYTFQSFSSDEIVNLVTWAGFLILTGAIVGSVSEQREARMRSLSQAYIGALDIVIKYLESADEERPKAARVALLAGKLAEKLGLSRREVENIKSAALLIQAGDMATNLPFLEKAASFMESEMKKPEATFKNKEIVMLSTTAYLLKEIKPIMLGYYQHYVQEASVIDKDIQSVPLASSLIALAEAYDRLSTRIYPAAAEEKFTSLLDLQKMSGRFFPEEAVKALFDLISFSR